MLRFPLILSAGALCVGATLVDVSSADAADCRALRGYYEESTLIGPQCMSPVGLCTTARLSGPFTGDARYTAAAIIASPDTPRTGVVFIVGDTTVTGARLGSRRGTLFLKNAAAVRTASEGDVTDTTVIVGGTDGFAGAAGSLRATGTIDSATGASTSTYEGTICFP